MPARTCESCHQTRAQVLRPKNHQRLCGKCFIAIFEQEVAETITNTHLFEPGERIAIGASGGKDSTVLASVLKTLNDRFGWGLDLVLLSIDEGITGYRDHSLDAVRRNAASLDLPLTIVSYAELYGWSMDQVVAQVGRKGNCTYCGVFRRQALDRGAARLGVAHVVTGHNADDVAETVLMNLLRGDLPRLSRATSIVTSTPSQSTKHNASENAGTVSITDVKRSKPLIYAYEKEIVLYAHHKSLDYFSTECIYSPEAFRGSARTLIKNLERIRPESILDVIKSGIDMARLVPDAAPHVHLLKDDESTNGCGRGAGEDDGGDMADMERRLRQEHLAQAHGIETEIKFPAQSQQKHEKSDTIHLDQGGTIDSESVKQGQGIADIKSIPIHTKQQHNDTFPTPNGQSRMQKLGRCQRCGYLSSQPICKACVLLEGLNKARPKTGVEVRTAHD